MKIALAQVNTTVAAFQFNLDKLIGCLKKAESQDCDLLVFPELTLTGYPPRDLLNRPDFVDQNLVALKNLQDRVTDTAVIVGFVDRVVDQNADRNKAGHTLYNSLAFLYQGECLTIYHKKLLPNYDVFDELRYFKPGSNNGLVQFKDKKIALSICEDIWALEENHLRAPYATDPLAEQALESPDLYINISASPYHENRSQERCDFLKKRVQILAKPLIYLNLVGANDELIFDGNSLVFNEKAELALKMESCREDFSVVDLNSLPAAKLTQTCFEEELLTALTLGLKDYCQKTGFQKVVLGISGGIDSALTAWIAVQALGAGQVLGLAMPSCYSSEHSLKDAETLANNLGIRWETQAITPIYQQFLNVLNISSEEDADLTMQNLQARIRGTLLMAYANREGRLLLNTSNKSELAMGYATLYGDMAGALSIISDLTKAQVYSLARKANELQFAIPESSLTKAPSAELAANQKDQDELPDYSIVDALVEEFVEKDHTIDLSAQQMSMLKRVDINEYKRRQMAPGLRVSRRSFGISRRIPLAQKFYD